MITLPLVSNEEENGLLFETIILFIHPFFSRVKNTTLPTPRSETKGKCITAMDNEARATGLSDYEYAFYTAVTDNESAKEVMQQDKIKGISCCAYRNHPSKYFYRLDN